MTEQTALSPEERRRLRRRQHWMISSFVLGAALLLATVFWPFGARAQFLVWLAGIVLLVVSAVLQFTRRCPRCGAIIGIQSRLALPPACRRCGVALGR